ncbi:NDMA-dependent alcohol dehydrogenase [Rhodococcus opacus]|uniref:NDMA-dependent alcohol dehydrogenase n=1 Tax=Rhodococcus opacus TaxID=37919 RepID=UPI001C493E52|nr:NDMA-dependent alcohol dehydrogenase [Rhodococcus opacus]MBV6754881.1 NDMA-dependent alcohol dehydrogenase [Rhodococcus opacus]
MKSKAAVLLEPGKPLEILEVELVPPGPGEVLVRWTASGLCHSDLHVIGGHLPARLPMIMGHEGAGVVEEVGAGVFSVAPGDHVVCSFLPSCGRCRWCASGHSNLCNDGANLLEGCLPNGRFTTALADGTAVGRMCMLGTFSERAVVAEASTVKIDDWLPLDKAALVGCGVTTGFGAAVNTANIRTGDTVVIFGCGGLGINAVQGAVHAGARYIFVIDPEPRKLQWAIEFGATHAFSSFEQAQPVITEVTWGEGADKAIVLAGEADATITGQAFALTGKRGEIVLVSMGASDAMSVTLPGTALSLYEKSVKGCLFGSANPRHEIPRLLRMYDAGQYKLDELVTSTYTLDEINRGYEDMQNGLNLRGLLVLNAG